MTFFCLYLQIIHFKFIIYNIPTNNNIEHFNNRLKPQIIMKKLILSICAFMAVYTASNAQFSAKEILVGGSFDYTYQDSKTTDDLKSTSNYLTITPEVAYMLTKSVAIGIDFGVLSSKSTSQNNIYTILGNTIVTSKNTNKFFSPSIFIQKFFPISSNLYWSMKTEVGYGWGKSTYGEDSQKYTALGFGISPELDYFISKKVGIKANFNGLNYTYTSYKNENKSNRFSVNLNPSNWEFGVFVKL